MRPSSLNIDIQNITKYLEDNTEEQTYKLNVEPIESRMTIDLLVFYTNEKELYTSADLQQLSKKVEILKGSLEKLSRSNIIYYINADDLLSLDLGVTDDQRPIYLKLVSEQPRIKKTTALHRSATAGSNSTKRVENSHSPGRRKSSGRDHRAEKSPRTQELNLVTKPIKLYNTDILIEYIKSSRKYSIFILTSENGVISCKGTYDEHIKSSDIINLKTINKKYDKSTEVTIYATSTTSLSFPIYATMTTDNFECTVEKFLYIFESLTSS